jgi:hypothetical protein
MLCISVWSFKCNGSFSSLSLPSIYVSGTTRRPSLSVKQTGIRSCLLLTRLSSSLAARRWDSIASKSILGIAVSMLYTSKPPVTRLEQLIMILLRLYYWGRECDAIEFDTWVEKYTDAHPRIQYLLILTRDNLKSRVRSVIVEHVLSNTATHCSLNVVIF